jgi:hypothetical protein
MTIARICPWCCISSLYVVVAPCKPVEHLIHDDGNRHRSSDYVMIFFCFDGLWEDFMTISRTLVVVTYDKF